MRFKLQTPSYIPNPKGGNTVTCLQHMHAMARSENGGKPKKCIQFKHVCKKKNPKDKWWDLPNRGRVLSLRGRGGTRGWSTTLAPAPLVSTRCRHGASHSAGGYQGLNLKFGVICWGVKQLEILLKCKILCIYFVTKISKHWNDFSVRRKRSGNI